MDTATIAIVVAAVSLTVSVFNAILIWKIKDYV